MFVKQNKIDELRTELLNEINFLRNRIYELEIQIDCPHPNCDIEFRENYDKRKIHGWKRCSKCGKKLVTYTKGSQFICERAEHYAKLAEDENCN